METILFLEAKGEPGSGRTTILNVCESALEAAGYKTERYQTGGNHMLKVHVTSETIFAKAFSTGASGAYKFLADFIKRTVREEVIKHEN